MSFPVTIGSRAINAQLSKEETNSSGAAKAELVVDGRSFGEFSATSLLALETHLKGLRNLYNTIPTLDPTKVWNKNDADGLYHSDKSVTFKTEKTTKVIVHFEPTEHHPGKSELASIDKNIGQWETVRKSGKITPNDKSKLLGRIDSFIAAVKK